MDVVSIGAFCFGLAVGYVTYRTLVRKEGGAQISDLAAVIAAIGGATVTGLFDPQQSDTFAWYSIGLLVGLAIYFVLSLLLQGKPNWAAVMGEPALYEKSATARQNSRVPDHVGPRD